MYPNLKQAFQLAGIKQCFAARELGMHASMISFIINGYREPTPEVRAKLAKYLKKDEAWLFQREELPKPGALAEAK